MLIGIVDLVLTIFFVRYRDAAEGNPLMAYYLSKGIPSFVVAKAVLCAVPLFILEYARRHRPRLVKYCMRGAIAAYLGSYTMGVAQMNDLATQEKVKHVDMAWIESPAPQFTEIMAHHHHMAEVTQ